MNEVAVMVAKAFTVARRELDCSPDAEYLVAELIVRDRRTGQVHGTGNLGVPGVFAAASTMLAHQVSGDLKQAEIRFDGEADKPTASSDEPVSHEPI